jgi:hypothetical protein
MFVKGKLWIRSPSYQFRKYEIINAENPRSLRWATRQAIECLGGEVLEDTATEVDPSVLGKEIDGMTVRDFDPHPRTGFQTQVEVELRKT